MIDFSKCICENPGFCDLYNKVMESSPPNWQWCKSATKEERATHYEHTKRKKRRAYTKRLINGPTLSSSSEPKFIKNSDLINTCINSLLPKLKNSNISGVVGIPRSGVFPASIIALHMGIPLYSISNNDIVLLNSVSKYGGFRMKEYSANKDDNLLFLDDTVCTGSTLNTLNATGIRACVYCHPQSLNKVDVYGEQLELPHFLEWNFFDLPHIINHSIFDIDGVLCPDVPFEIARNKDAYKKYISEVQPIEKNIPRHTIDSIVTGRLKKYEKETRQWLDRHGIKYNNIVMFPTDLESQRNNNHIKEVGSYKSRILSENKNVKFFIESCIKEASIIKDLNRNKYVICTNGFVNYTVVNHDKQKCEKIQINEENYSNVNSGFFKMSKSKNPIIKANCV